MSSAPRDRRFLASLLPVVAPPIDLRIMGRTLLHAAIVGLGAGILGGFFFVALVLPVRTMAVMSAIVRAVSVRSDG